ncbi:guanitoxin biosynthesis heme-dependent pre-guanitoxin N-hydroxylase GntA [uncultured Sphingomonas sp.]|uniref:guanitoxin biosynthesis heme-dependent pre-guanitoxin N-hydroxylase GntA n=1 Tax=uncultured Sphingomonas sp. TaxID=158754 RepID=UPI00260A624D|nr:guanitoxin biosynthesis heme-dependent pre-guanitoxin N-hydroxylase GntA [uncultured Sphingomonas sp.]
MRTISYQNDHPLAEAFISGIREASFPCVGAKSALAKGQMDILVARDLRSAWDDMRILPALTTTVAKYHADRALFRTLVVLFEGPGDLDEPGFEQHLWARAQSLSDKDEWLGYQPDPSVSTDPEDPHFSLSFAGEAFFVVGLHPAASRPARRFAAPAMVFNLHDQFEVLREQQRYEKLRASILARDLDLAGSLNPMLARHGEISEARQYSGREVPSDWRCPFHRGGGAAHG